MRRSIAITGASSGIGAALAQALAAPGITLALLGRDRSRLESVAEACTAKGAICRIGAIDVNDRPAMATFIGELVDGNGLDLLIANAGIFAGRPASSATEFARTAEEVFRTNLLATIDTVHCVLPSMLRNRRGEILLVASLSAFAPLQDAPAYSASKAALVSYGLALRDAVAGEGVRVVVACPGYVTTPLVAKHRGARPLEISADVAARKIVKGLDRNRDIIGFPLALYWVSKLVVWLPERLRRAGTVLFRFHVDP